MRLHPAKAKSVAKIYQHDLTPSPQLDKGVESSPLGCGVILIQLNNLLGTQGPPTSLQIYLSRISQLRPIDDFVA